MNNNPTPVTPPSVARAAKVTKRRRKVNYVLVAAAVVVLGCVIFSGYMYNQMQAYKENPNKAAADEQKRVLSLVRKHYRIPTYKTTENGKDAVKEDTPTIATVADKTKLTNQTFFAAAENGDKIVVFPNAKIAVLYRESTDQIINSGPVVVDANQQAQKLAVKVIGSEAARNEVETVINAKFPGSTVIAKADANNKNITATTVVDVTGKSAEAARQLAAQLKNAKVGSLPAGEDMPTDASILIVAGAQ